MHKFPKDCIAIPVFSNLHLYVLPISPILIFNLVYWNQLVTHSASASEREVKA